MRWCRELEKIFKIMGFKWISGLFLSGTKRSLNNTKTTILPFSFKVALLGLTEDKPDDAKAAGEGGVDNDV